MFDAFEKSKFTVMTSTIGTSVNVSNITLSKPPLTEADHNPDFAPQEGGMEAYKASKVCIYIPLMTSH